MSMRTRAGKKISLTNYEELLAVPIIESASDIPLDQLHEFKGHPFHVVDDEAMDELVESIKAKGVLSPAIARKRPEGGFELISGHRRTHAARRAGLDKIPVFIKDYSDDEAVCIMVDSNIQRERILPSEKAFALKMKMDAMRKQGSRQDLNSRQNDGKINSRTNKTSSIEQREGRGLRQGNENSEVAVYRYVTKGTFDAYSWSLVENKQRFISQVMTSKSISRSCEDIDEATLSYAEIKAVATGNPLIKEKMEVDNEVQRLKMLKASYDSQHYSLQDQFMIKFPKLIAAANEKLKCVHGDIKKRDEQVLAADEKFTIKVGNMTFHERVDGGTAVLAAVSKCKVGETTGIGEYRGFEVQVEKNFIGVNYLILHGRTDYKVELSNSPVGCMVKLENCFNGMDGNIEFLEKKLEQYQRDMEQAKAEYEKPFDCEEELKSKTARQFELNTQLDLENKPITEENGQEISQVAENAYPYGERKDYR